MPMTERQKVLMLMNGGEDPAFEEWWATIVARTIAAAPDGPAAGGPRAARLLQLTHDSARMAWGQAVLRYCLEEGE